MNEQQRKLHDEIAKKLTDEGKLIEAGWATMNALVLPADAPPVQRSEMRKAFFMGAQHLYASIMAIMDADRDPTAQDLKRMGLIHNELEAFRMEITSAHKPGKG